MSTQPAERTVGYGSAYPDAQLELHCGTCKAPAGTACTKRGGALHTTRIDKVRRFCHRQTWRGGIS